MNTPTYNFNNATDPFQTELTYFRSMQPGPRLTYFLDKVFLVKSKMKFKTKLQAEQGYLLYKQINKQIRNSTFSQISLLSLASNNGNPKCISSKDQSSNLFVSPFSPCVSLQSSYPFSCTVSPSTSSSSFSKSSECTSPTTLNIVVVSTTSLPLSVVRCGLSNVI